MRLVIGLLLAFLMFSACLKRHPVHTIKVQFEVDGKPLDISNNFKFFFLQDSIIKAATIEGNYLHLPKFSHSEKGLVTFVYKQYNLSFKNVALSFLDADQDMEWDFKLLTSNFSQISTDIDTIKLKRLYVWGFNPEEWGDGIELTEPIYK